MLSIILQLNTDSLQREVQMPFDSAGKIYEIKKDLASTLSFFENYPDMTSALLFMQPDSTYVIELYYRKEHHVVKTRVPIDQESLLLIRNEIIQRPIEPKISAMRDRSGAWLYLTNSLVFSYCGRAPLLLIATSPDDYRVVITLYLLSSTAGFFIPMMITKNTDITYAHAFSSWFGATRGVYAGYVIGYCLDNNYSESDAWFPLFGSIIGDVAGFKATPSGRRGVGKIGLITTMADWGTVCIPAVVALADDSTWFDEKIYLLTSLGGLAGGILGGNYLSRKLDLQDGDPRIFRLYGALGAATLPIILYWFDGIYPSEHAHRLYIASGLIGCGIGSYLGWRAIKNKDYSFGDGVMLEVGSIAGGMATSGLLLLADIWTETDFSAQVYATTALAGAMLGSVFTANQIKAGSASGNSKLLLHPESLGFIALAKNYDIPCRVPLVTFSF